MMSSSCAVGLLTRRLAHAALGAAAIKPMAVKALGVTAVPPFSPSVDLQMQVQVRSFATKKKKISKKLKNQQARANKGKVVMEENPQHEQWVGFQNAISVEGYETGQTTVVDPNAGKKRRGGRKFRLRRERREAAEKLQADNAILGPGEYPALRYSDEETERLLKEAYEGIPKKMGGKGTRNLRRQKNRWHRVREHRKISKKNYGIRTHERRMESRSRIVGEVMAVKAEADYLNKRDAAYQQFVLNRWTEIMFGGGMDINNNQQEREEQEQQQQN